MFIHPYKIKVYLLGHMGKHHDYNFPQSSIVVGRHEDFKSKTLKLFIMVTQGKIKK